MLTPTTSVSSEARLCACGCGASLASLRPDARYAGPACRLRAHRARSRDQLSDEDREWCRRAAVEACDELGLPPRERYGDVVRAHLEAQQRARRAAEARELRASERERSPRPSPRRP